MKRQGKQGRNPHLRGRGGERERERHRSQAEEQNSSHPLKDRAFPFLSFPFTKTQRTPAHAVSRGKRKMCHPLALEIPCAFNHSAYHLTKALLPLKASLEIFDLASPCLLLLGHLPLFLHPLLLLQEKSRAREREYMNIRAQTETGKREERCLPHLYLNTAHTERQRERERDESLSTARAGREGVYRSEKGGKGKQRHTPNPPFL